jgi:hypothetical protein
MCVNSIKKKKAWSSSPFKPFLLLIQICTQYYEFIATTSIKFFFLFLAAHSAAWRTPQRDIRELEGTAKFPAFCLLFKPILIILQPTERTKHGIFLQKSFRS